MDEIAIGWQTVALLTLPDDKPFYYRFGFWEITAPSGDSYSNTLLNGAYSVAHELIRTCLPPFTAAPYTKLAHAMAMLGQICVICSTSNEKSSLNIHDSVQGDIVF